MALALGLIGVTIYPLGQILSSDPTSYSVGDDVPAAMAMAAAEHGDDGYIEEEQDREVSAMGAAEHAHGKATVDPNAPIVHLFALEFGYTPGDFEVEAGHAFTIMFHNEGRIEHDVTIEGAEGQGGIHLRPGEDGMATFELHEPGTYTYYCGVPGHREAGMFGTLVVEADGHGDDDGHEDGT